MEMEMAFGAPATINRSPCPAHEVADAQSPVDSKVSPAEYLERMNGRLRLEVPAVRGEHKVEMRGTVPAEWSLL
jgi:hypothetical protein